jgi:hypothetical protein
LGELEAQMLTFSKIGKHGRLGNQMFQIAGTIGIAQRCGYQFGFPEWEFQQYFTNKLPEYTGKPLPTLTIDWNELPEYISDDCDLFGYMQSEKYFKQCSGLIRKFFELKPISHYPLPDNAVCVHVRRGDYDGITMPLLGMEYYSPAMAKFPDSIFYVFSDDIPACIEMFGDTVEYIQGNEAMFDFYLMTKFNRHIISNSTFSWWGAYLSKSKEVIAPKRWFAPCYLDAKDIYTNEMQLI